MSTLFNRNLKAKMTKKAEDEFDLIDGEEMDEMEEDLNLEVVSLDEESVTEIVEQLAEEIEEAVMEVVEDVKEAAVEHKLTQAGVLHVLKRLNQAGLQIQHPRLAGELPAIRKSEEETVRKIVVAAVDLVEEILRRAAVFVSSRVASSAKQARIAASLDRTLTQRKIAKTSIASPKEVKKAPARTAARTPKKATKKVAKKVAWLNLK